MNHKTLIGAALAALPALQAAGPPPAGAAAATPGPADYAAEVAAWRAARDVRLRADDGWLTLVGLAWLAPGANRFGSAHDDDVRLPAPVPRHAGTLELAGHDVRLVVPKDSPLLVDGEPARTGALRTDATPNPAVVSAGSISFQIIDRGERVGVRVRDRQSALRRSYPGSRWYPVDPSYRVVARLIPREAGKTEMVVPDATGGRQKLTSPGTLSFTLLGQTRRLDPVLDGDDPADQLVVFRDETSGRETYGGGRFVRAHRQPDGTFVVDFNRAYSPPCALTPYATCPLPPEQNRLRAAVRAGQRSQEDDAKGARR
jgi:uncharacterized protein (DUF1684 family)